MDPKRVVSLRFSGPDICALGLEPVGVFFTRCPHEHVLGRYQFHIRQSGALDGVQVLSFQESAADSSGPEVHVLLGLVGHLFIGYDVGQIQASAGLQNPEYLLEHRVFIGGQVDYTVGDDHVHRVVGDG